MAEQYTDLDTIVSNISEYESTKPDLKLKYEPSFSNDLEMPDVVRVRNLTPKMIKENWQVKEKGFFQNFGRGIATDQGRQISDLFNSNWTLPNADDDVAKDMADIVMRGKLLRDAHREYVDREAGYSADSGWAKAGRGVGNAFGSSIQYAVIGGLTGGAGIFAAGAAQSALQSDENWKKTYFEENGTLDGYEPVNQLYSVANGAVQGFIEEKLGVENLLASSLKKSGLGVASWTARKALKGLGGEAAEEFTQEITEYGFGKLAGQERRDSEQLAKDALTAAVYGGIVGGAMGSSMYYANRRNLSKALQKTGMSPELANATAQDAIDAGTEKARKEIIIRAQLQDRFGGAYTGLVDKIDSALSLTDWQANNPGMNQKEYATENADTIAKQVMDFADMNGMTTDDVLNLADIQVIDNVVYLDQSVLGDIDTKIKTKQARIKELTRLAKTGVGDSNEKANLTKQVEILQKAREKQSGERYTESRKIRDKKAEVDALSIIQNAPQAANVIDSIPETTYKKPSTAQISEQLDENESFIYVGNKQIAVDYEVKEMDEVIPSHIGDEKNPDYSLKALQNREARGSKVDLSILQSRAANIQPENMGVSYNMQSGSPVINDRGEIIAGNGRFEVLRMTDDKGRAKYNNYIKKLGFDISGFKNPVLVRSVSGLSDEQQIALADASNISQTSAFDEASQAKQDAKLLKGTATALDFFKKIPTESQQGLILSNGLVNLNALQNRYENALMMDLLDGDVRIYDMLYSQEDGAKIVKGITQALPNLYSLSEKYPSRDIKKELRTAFVMMKGLNKKNFAYKMSEQQPFGIDADIFITNSLLYNFTFSNAQGISAFVNNYSAMAEDNSNQSKETNLFGNQVAPELPNNEIIANLLVKTYDTQNAKDPVFDENGVALQKEMRAVMLSQSAQPLAPSLFNQTDIKADINSPEFKKWFGDSKVVDADVTRQNQLNIIQKTNPAPNDNLTWIRSIDDIKTFSEAMQDEESFAYPDFTKSDAEKALKDGSITVYSSTPIEDGKFITPSKMQAKDYAGNGKIYEQAMDLSDIAWINADEGQVAKNAAVPLVVYHGTDAEFDTFDNTVNEDKSRQMGAEYGYFFTSSKKVASRFTSGKNTEEVIINFPVIVNGEISHYGQTKQTKNKGIREVYLSIKNPIEYDGEYIGTGVERESAIRLAKANGYDGMIIKNADTGAGIADEYIAFEPNQIKSVNNEGTFSSETGNIYKQGKSVNGYFDPELQVIVLGKNTNSGTLPHEMAHFWLEKMFNLSRNENASWTPEFINGVGQLFKILGVSDNQKKLTVEQHEQFATMSEAYIFQLAPLPEGTEYAFNRFMRYVPPKYENILSVGYRDENGNIKHPLLDKMSIDWFNAWYGNATLPMITESPAGLKSLNSVDNSGNIIPSKKETIADRESELDNGAKETESRQNDQAQQIDNSTTQADKAQIEVKTREILSAPDLIENDVASLELEEPKRFNWLRRNTNSEQIKKAEEYKKANKEHAYEIAFGDPQWVANDSGIKRAFIIKSVMNDFKVGSDEDTELRWNYAMDASLSGSSLQAHRGESMALFIESKKKLYNDINKEDAYKIFGKNKNAIESYIKAKWALIEQHTDIVMSTSPDSIERDKAIDNLMKQGELQFGGEGDARLLKQLDLTGRKTTSRDVFMAWADKELRKILLNPKQRERVSKLYSEVEKARKASIEIDSNDKTTYTAAALIMTDFNKFIHATDDNNWMQKVFGSYAINAMLSNPSTHIVNIASNSINYPVVLGAMKAQFKAQGVSNTVPRDKIKAQTEKLHTIYGKTYLNLATMDNIGSESIMVGERYKLPDQDKKSILNLPGRALSKADTWFRFSMFSEAAAMIASKEAKATGRNSSEIFDEICSMNTKKGKNSPTNRAAELRQEALMIANMATFTQDGTLEKTLNKVRSAINSMTGNQNFGLGNLLAPFIKTPANIVEMGARAIPATFYKAIGATFDVKGRKAGKYTWGIKDTLGWSYLALGVIATLAVASDYEPPYEPPQAYDDQKPYDSIKIFGVWIKLDAFGPFAIPMRMTASSMYSDKFTTGLLNDMPLVDDISQQANLWNRSPTMAASKYVYNQGNKLVPAILKPGIQVINRNVFDKQDLGFDLGVKTGIGRSVARQYGLDGRNMDIVDFLMQLSAKKVQIDSRISN